MFLIINKYLIINKINELYYSMYKIIWLSSYYLFFRSFILSLRYYVTEMRADSRSLNKVLYILISVTSYRRFDSFLSKDLAPRSDYGQRL